MTGTTVSGNDANWGAGIYFERLDQAATVANTTISGNVSDYGGGGVWGEVRGSG